MGVKNSADKLLATFTQFQKTDWDQKIIPGYKTSELKVLLCIKNKTSEKSVGVMVSEISNTLRVTSPTVTQLVNGLERGGLVGRYIDPLDRRVVRIQLTKKGLVIAKQAEAKFSASFQGLVHHLGEEQSDVLADLLTQVFSYFEQNQKI